MTGRRRQPRPGAAQGPGELRIIGGQWRGRKLSFLAAEGLRPTPNRIRETLFNWLAPVLHGARCADLFAGSGALGLEALSRGAAHCDFVDSNPVGIEQIRRHLDRLDASRRAHCHSGTAAEFLASAEQAFDIVFLDPPFGRELVAPTCQQLRDRSLLAPGAFIYIETGTGEEGLTAFPDWRLHREGRAGAVQYFLYQLEN